MGVSVGSVVEVRVRVEMGSVCNPFYHLSESCLLKWCPVIDWFYHL